MLGVIGLVATVMVSCNKDEGPDSVTVVSVTTTGGVALDGATATEDVALDQGVVITFSRAIDETTATTTTVTLASGSSNVGIAVSVSEAVVTITPENDLSAGTNYTLSLSGVKAKDGGILSSFSPLTFKTNGRASVEPPHASDEVAYWNFDGNTDDAVNGFDANEAIDLTYGTDRFGFEGFAAKFNGTSTIVEVPEATDLVETADFTLSFWVKPNSENKTSGHFVMGLGGVKGFQFEIAGNYANCKLAAQYDFGDGTSGGEDLWCDATGNLGWQGWTFSKDYTAVGGFETVIKDKWVHIICTYNSTTLVGSMYVNGELAKSQDFDNWPDGDKKRGVVGLTWAGESPDYVGNLAFGFITDRSSTAFDGEPWGNYESADSNHFKGMLDDVRIFHAAFSAENATALYNAEKP